MLCYVMFYIVLKMWCRDNLNVIGDDHGCIEVYLCCQIEVYIRKKLV